MPTGNPAGYLPNAKRGRRTTGRVNKKAALGTLLAQNHQKAQSKSLELRDRERQLRHRQRSSSMRKP